MTSLHCVVIGCSNGGYRLFWWREDYCDIHGCLHREAQCTCQPPFRLIPIPTRKSRPLERDVWKFLINRMDSGYRSCLKLPLQKGKRLLSPAKYQRVCSRHFVDSEPTKENPYPTLNLGYSDQNQVNEILCVECPHQPQKKETSEATPESGHQSPDVRYENTDDGGPPVLRDGCLWPTVDHTYCCQFPPADNAAANTRARARKFTHRKKKLENGKCVTIVYPDGSRADRKAPFTSGPLTALSSAAMAETWAETPQTRTKKSQTRTKKSQTHTQTSQTHTQTSRSRTQTSRICTQTSQTRTQTSQTHTQTSRSRTQTSRTCTQTSRTHTQTSQTHTQTSQTRTQTSRTCTQTSRTRTQTSAVGDKTRKMLDKVACCVRGCRSTRHNKKKSFFCLPAHKARCKKWLQNIGRQDLLGKSLHQLRIKGYRVCSNHFHSDHLRHTTGKTLRLYPNAVPTLLTSGKRPPQKKGSDREESPAVSMPEVKVELDWAEDPTMYCYPDVYPEEADSELKPRTSGDLQAASGHGGRSVSSPGTADCDMDTSPNIEDCIKSECAEETCVSVNSESLDTSPQGVDFVKSEDIEEEEETMSANLAEVIKPEIVEEGEEECSSVSRENMKHSSQFHKGSREQTSPEQLERWGAVSMDVTSDGGCVDSREQLSGHGRQTTASDVLEEDDVDMTYTVVKAEPESDVEEQ